MTDEISFPLPSNLKKVPAKGLMAATALELRALKKILKLQEAGTLLGPGLGQLYLGENFFLAGPFLGGPMAVLILEELGRRGAKEIMFLGLAGSLGDFAPGQLLAPFAALSTEGASRHYPAPLNPHLGWHSEFIKQNPDVSTGVIWSTDALYRETKTLIAQQKAQGAQAVDMECCALMAAANFRQIKFLALLIISDIITDKHFLAFGEKAFKDGLQKSAQKAVQYLEAPPA